MDQLNVHQKWPPVPVMKKKHSVTNTIYFILHKYKPKDRRATYVIVVYDIRPQKIENHRTILTEGGNIIYHPG